MLSPHPEHRPKVALLGVGGVGGVVAAALEHAGHCDLTLISRGATLEALRTDGLLVKMPYSQSEYRCKPRVAAIDALAAEAGEQDYVFCITKAHQLPPLVDQLLPLFGPNTVLVPCMNGIPFWYYHGLPNVEDRPIAAVDPGSRLFTKLGSSRAIGCVVRVGGSVAVPGVVVSAGATSMLEFGEPDGKATARLDRLVSLFADAEDKPVPFAVKTQPSIRNAVWDKLVFNVVGNPLQTLTQVIGDLFVKTATVFLTAELTQATCGDLVADPKLRKLCAQIMDEMFALGAAMHPPIEFSVSMEQLVTGFTAYGGAKASTLQDLEAGRPFEKDALLTAVQDMAHDVGVPTPFIDMAAALLQGLERNAVLNKL